MKKMIMLIMMLLLLPIAFAATNDMASANITLNFPTDLSYTGSTGSTNLPLLNATVRYNINTLNITNVTFIFTSGSTRFAFANVSVNGSKTGSGLADFTYRIQANSLTANLAYTVVAEIRNNSVTGENDGAVNSSSITYTLDSTLPSISLTNPLSGSTVVPSGIGEVIFEYTPTDTNFGNCSLHLNNAVAKSSTSVTTSSNFSSGSLTRFRNKFAADNSSVRSVIVCTDLAGNVGASNNFTFNVLFGATPLAIKQAQIAASGGGGIGSSAVTQQVSGFSVAPPSAYISETHFQKYAWVYVIAVVIIIGLIIRRKFK